MPLMWIEHHWIFVVSYLSCPLFSTKPGTKFPRLLQGLCDQDRPWLSAKWPLPAQRSAQHPKWWRWELWHEDAPSRERHSLVLRHTFLYQAIYLHVTSERIHVALVMCNQLEPKHICSIIPLFPTTSSTSTILLRRIHIRQHGIAGWKQASQCSSCSSTAYQQPHEAHDQRIAKGRQWAQDHTNTHLKWNQAT